MRNQKFVMTEVRRNMKRKKLGCTDHRYTRSSFADPVDKRRILVSREVQFPDSPLQVLVHCRTCGAGALELLEDA